MSKTAPLCSAFLLVGFVLIVASNAIAQDEKAEKKTEFYKPVVQTVEGWTIKLDPKLLSDSRKSKNDLAMKALANHLQRITFILPEAKVNELRKLPIWLELSGVGGIAYHPSPRWLEEHGQDPAMGGHVHVANADSLLDPKQWAKHPYLMMHELAHAYHDQVLGWDDGEIIKAFKQAKKAGIYEEVLAHNHRTVEHYALSNHKEYFAESTEAYLGVNDFYPFVRAELKKHDPRMFDLQRKIWGDIK
ncbi:MAG: metallopeptidase [Mariniblastus sp.]